ncbi:MAG: peptide chain release factor N(5)-glutamine methyltransferase, partial [Clostridia bacterium]|nr:peptide chain release factor N(5)-glutamine methyltransferase [Clostridia bacterium]
SLNIQRDEVYGQKKVSFKDETKVIKVVNERITGRPLWYCIGNTDFMGYEIKVDERVLIPRPETEVLVESALKYIDESKTVLDLCTGSGAIAIAVNLKTGAKVFASDISSDAISLAKENAHALNANVNFVQSDMFSEFKKTGGKFDVIISNPPYIKTDDICTLQKEVKDFEPKSALDGGKDGLDFYRIIAQNVKDLLNSDGVLIMECGDSQAKQIKEMLTGFSSVEIIKDLENIDRIVKAVL